MPLFDFKCEQCNVKTESIQPAQTKEIRCQCGGIAKKQLSRPGKFDLRGDGFYSPTKTRIQNDD